MKPRRQEHGFTIIELLVVIAIVAILASMAAVSLRRKIKPMDAAERVGDIVREANRRAVALGPVRANVALALNFKARTRVIGSGTSPQPTFILQRLVEDPNPASTTASWVEIQRYTLDADVTADSWDTGVNTKAVLDPTQTDWTAFETRCYPDGLCDAVTVFLHETSASPGDFARLSIMPLGGAIMTRQDWN
jgi:prepilin-type N-terminal cleavage/methylation domain-containing protein